MKCKIPSVGPTAEELRSRAEVHVVDFHPAGPSSSSSSRFLNATARMQASALLAKLKQYFWNVSKKHMHKCKKDCLHPFHSTIPWNIASGASKIVPAINIFSFLHFFFHFQFQFTQFESKWKPADIGLGRQKPVPGAERHGHQVLDERLPPVWPIKRNQKAVK